MGFKVTVFYNPAAGGMGKPAFWAEAERALTRVFGSVRFVETIRGHMVHQAEALANQGADLMIAAGGDGTAGALADGILRSLRPHTAFSLLKAGSGSDFARNFAWEHALEDQLVQIRDEAARKIDMLAVERQVNGDFAFLGHCLNIASLGVSGEIIAKMAQNSHKTRLPHRLRYRLSTLSGILAYRGRAVEIFVDGKACFQGPILFAAIANGCYFGAGLAVAGRANLQDGLLNLVFATHRGVIGNVKSLMQIEKQKHEADPHFHIIEGREIMIFDRPAASSPSRIVKAEADGEPLPTDFWSSPQGGNSAEPQGLGQAWRFRVEKAALTVKLPPDRRDKQAAAPMASDPRQTYS